MPCRLAACLLYSAMENKSLLWIFQAFHELNGKGEGFPGTSLTGALTTCGSLDTPAPSQISYVRGALSSCYHQTLGWTTKAL